MVNGHSDKSNIRQAWKGMALSFIIGMAAVLIKQVIKAPILDPLVVAMLIGIVIRGYVKLDEKFVAGYSLVPFLLIPIGVVCYGAVNFLAFLAQACF